MQLILISTALWSGCSSPVIPLDAGSTTSGVEEGENAAAPWGTADWTVDCAGSGDFETISEAIDAAASGDWILVESCTYDERIDYAGKSLYIQSRAGSGSTTLDAESGGVAVTATHGEDSRTALVGFTIENSRTAAVWLDFASLHVEDVVVTDGSGEYLFYTHAGDLELQNVVTTGNSETSAVVYASRGTVQIDESSFECGRSSYGLHLNHGAALVDHSSVDCGRDYSVVIEHTTGVAQRSSFTGGMYIQNEDKHPEDSFDLYNSVVEGSMYVEYGGFTLVNSILDGGTLTYVNNLEYPGSGTIANSVLMNSKCAVSSDGGTHTVVNNDFFDTTPSCGADVWVGVDDNIDGDPLFVDAKKGDFHLQAGSPLEDAGTDDYTGDDVDGSDNDIGVYGGHWSMDGGW